jgi:hypothetical protein
MEQLLVGGRLHRAVGVIDTFVATVMFVGSFCAAEPGATTGSSCQWVRFARRSPAVQSAQLAKRVRYCRPLLGWPCHAQKSLSPPTIPYILNARVEEFR